MRKFSEFYEDKENQEPLNEDVLTAILTGVLGLPVLLALAWGASWATKKYIKFGRKVILNIVNNIKSIGDLFRKDRKEAIKKIEGTIQEIEKAPEVKKALGDVEKLQNKYYNELSGIYSSLEKKDIDKAEEQFEELPVNLKENPEVKVALINVILQSFEEPPIYVVSPGNDTYQAIKRLFGQKIARAMEELGKRGFNKYYQRTEEES